MNARIMLHLNGDFTVQNYTVAGPSPTHTLEIADGKNTVAIYFRTAAEVERIQAELDKIRDRILGTGRN